jgi:hypothetical protein
MLHVDWALWNDMIENNIVDQAEWVVGGYI